MYFLPAQANEYDQRRLEARGVEQLDLFVSDEKSAIQWVRMQLASEPMTYQELQPIYMRECSEFGRSTSSRWSFKRFLTRVS